MSTQKNDLNNSVESLFEDFVGSLNGEKSSVFHQERVESFDLLKNIGFPTAKTEDYRYTPIYRDLKNVLSDSGTKTTSKEINPDDFIPEGLEGNFLFFINGVFHQEYSRTLEGFIPSWIKENFENNKDHFNKLTFDYKDSFALLNTALINDGLFINIPDNTQVKDSINIINIQVATDGKSYSQQRNLIVLGKSAHAEISEFYFSIGENDSFLNQLTEIIIGENANLEFNRIGLEEDKGYQLGNTYVKQSRSSRLNASTFTLGGARTRNNLNIQLDGEGIETNMNGLYLLNGDSHSDHHTIVDHLYPHSESNELYKGILDGNSTGVFNGKIFVRQDAQKTNAFQSNNNILLTDDASINTKPQLEIWADDVKCTHGCTTGQLDDEAVFYLRSRGLDHKTSVGVLLHAFAGEVVQKVKNEAIGSFLDRKVVELLHAEW